ncbi:hypothetical protein HUJ04_009476 [Dendroctonus ponderosae]|nr:hypothetical protein HUJ04_009476 [Dendroctonus ponderosae]
MNLEDSTVSAPADQTKTKKTKDQNQTWLKAADVPLEGTANNKLTEKQLRKLEWGKKMAEQKKDSADGTEKRREQQEAQRQEVKVALHQQAKHEPVDKLCGNLVSVTSETDIKLPVAPQAKKLPGKSNPRLKKSSRKHVQWVQHLYSLPNPEYSSKLVNFNGVHPSFVKLGVWYSERVILGSNERCFALLGAIKTLIEDIETPPTQDFYRHVEDMLQSCTNYLQECRPFAVSMSNALRSFKLQLRPVDSSLSDEEKRARLLGAIETYISNDMVKAWDAICLRVNEKIWEEDVILTYGCSSLISKILLRAKNNGKNFSVIIADSRPLLEGRELLRRLVSAHIKCSYVLNDHHSSVMKRASKVLVGAHALLTNGCLMSRIGTAQLALAAHNFNKPVLVCCEIYKFSELVQTDSFEYNDIGDPDLLYSVDGSSAPSPLRSYRNSSKLDTLNLLYDITPPHLITGVATESAILPCTSVPAILRINSAENM